MNIKFEKVFERDIDMLIINKFINDNSFKDFFLSKINLNNYQVVHIDHSLMDNDGESDITVIMSNDNKRIALLIEDKINARAMPNQKERYDKRGKKGIQDGVYDEYYVFLVAPLDYLKNNLEAKKYENTISYESLLKLLYNDQYAISLITEALSKKKKEYSVIENKQITLFWKKYYDYMKEHYPQLDMNKIDTPKGSKAIWPHILTPIKNIYILHKSNLGYMDLTFKGLGDNYYQFQNMIGDLLDKDMTIHQTGKSLVIRLHVPVIDFNNSFDDYIDEIDLSLKNASKLLKLFTIIDFQTIIDRL